MSRSSRPRAHGLLEAALLFTFACHGLAMLGMAALLLPAMPGGGADDAARVAYIAEHTLRFRLGWLPWHVTAASDLVLAWALLRTPWLPRGPAVVSAILTAFAVVPDQLGQYLWLTRGVELAREAHAGGQLGAYLAYEATVFPITAGWAALLYSVGAVAWSVCFARAGAWSLLTFLSVPLWSTFCVVSVAPLLPPALRPSSAFVAAGNALGFVAMEAWFLLVTEQVMRRACPDAPHGRWAPWRAPDRIPLGALFTWLANLRVLRAVCSWLPVVDFRSDITDVVYVSYVVPAERLTAWIPPGLELQLLGPKRDRAMFSFLTYRHGCFGPRMAGPLRRLFGSPLHTNWRTYVRDPRTGTEGIYFVTQGIGALLQALGGRIMAEGLPMHLLGAADLRRAADGAIEVVLEPGGGSAPDARIALRPGPRELPASFREVFDDYDAFLAYTVPQDRAMSTQPWLGRTTREEIDLGIPLASCEPLAGRVDSRAAAAIVGDDAEPVCFRVPAVPFQFVGEHVDRWAEGPASRLVS